MGAGILTAALAGLERRRQRLEEQILEVKALLGKRKVGSPQKAEAQLRPKRQLSAAARQRISAAQKRRWAEFHRQRAAAA